MKISKKQKHLVQLISHKASSSQWRDWHWQMAHAVRDIASFERLLNIQIPSASRNKILKTLNKFPMSITPYYLSLINTENLLNDPIFKQSFPSVHELRTHYEEMKDPLAEEKDSPVPGITHRYPDRVLFLVSNMCPMYCRHCTRKRKVGDVDFIPKKSVIEQGLNYIRKTPAIRDVLLSGGDPLLLSDSYLQWILEALRAIPHVEIIRIGTRTPVVLPYRITPNLIRVLRKAHPLWLNTHFNHPRELTQSSREALAKLADAGIPLGNQTVLLAGVNDCPLIIKSLVHQLVKNRVRPYYLFQCDLSEGLSHFRTPVAKGIEIMESLIGHTSGLAVPTYVIDAPNGAGKIPVMPNYLISSSTNKVVLRNYEGMITTYSEVGRFVGKKSVGHCRTCKLSGSLMGAEEDNTIGIEALLSDSNSTTSLTPMENERLKRRKKKYKS